MVVEAPRLTRALRGYALALALGSAAAAAQSFDVVGACRAGVPNGAYELHAPDGRIRVVGAFAQGRKTGTFIFWNSRGARVAVIPYDDDARTGTIALWHTAPGAGREFKRKLEAPYVANQLHGIKRSWYPDGRPRADATRQRHHSRRRPHLGRPTAPGRARPS